MEMEHVIQIIGLVVGGGFFGAILNHRISQKKLKQTDFDIITKEYRELIRQHHQEVQELKLEITQIQNILRDREKTITNLTLEIKELRIEIMGKKDKK
jgi:predicted RNase H-like nuclease (RuvC/YqgF family)